MDKETRAKYARKYYLAHREELIAKANRWKTENFEKWKAWREANKDRLKINHKEWVKSNHERRNAQKRKSYQNNKEAIRAKAKQRYDTDAEYRKQINDRNKERTAKIPREVINAANRERRRLYPDKFRAQRAKSRERHREKIYSAIHARRSRLRGSSGRYTVAEWRALKERANHCCMCCRKRFDKLTVDHVLPVAMGGSSSIDNIQPLCLKCNLRKGAKHIDYRPSFYSSPL